MRGLRTSLEKAEQSKLREIEIDTFQLLKGCPTACSHCSQDPKSKITQMMTLEGFTENVHAIIENGGPVFAPRMLTGRDTDPFYNPDFGQMVVDFNDLTGSRFYVLTSGWIGSGGQKSAEHIVTNSTAIERVLLTLSDFPENPVIRKKHVEILGNAIKTFSPLLRENKFVISPQYVADIAGSVRYSLETTEALLDASLTYAGISRSDFEGRLHYRPVEGFGRAITKLGLPKAEESIPTIADVSIEKAEYREERPYSGAITVNDELRVWKGPRGLLNQNIEGDYVSLEEI